MTSYLKIVALGFLVTSILSACTRNTKGGNPIVALANTNGTSKIFAVSEAQVSAAIKTTV